LDFSNLSRQSYLPDTEQAISLTTPPQ